MSKTFAPRSPLSFGVAGALSEKSKIYHDTLFTTRHLGRVSDLLVARLRELSVDELRLRALVLFTVFEGRLNTDLTADGGFVQPLIVECGVDEDWFAVGVSFVLKKELVPEDWKTFESRLQGTSLSEMSDLERLAHEVNLQAHQLLIRVHTQSHRVELVSLLDRGGLTKDIGQGAPTIVFIAAEPEEAPKVQEYRELADLEYSKLLEPDKLGKSPKAPVSGNTLVKAADRLAEEQTKIKGGSEGPDNTAILVKGKKEAVDNSLTTIKGVTQKTNDELIRVSSGPVQPSDPGEVSAYQKKISDLQKRILELETKHGEMPELSHDKQVAMGLAVATKPDDGLMDLEAGEHSVIAEAFKKFIGKAKETFKIGKKSEESNADGSDVVPENKASKKKSKEGKKSTEETEKELAAEEEAMLQQPKVSELEANNLIAELEEGSLEKTLDKARKEVVEIKKEIPSQGGKQWLEGFMADLVGEKARLQEMAKKVSVAMKQKDHEYKKKENALSIEMMKRDDELKQKELIIKQLKEQASRKNADADKQGSKSTQDKVDEVRQKERFEKAQRELGKSKDENATLQNKIRELSKQLTEIQSDKKAGEKAGSDLVRTKEKMDAISKQNDEFKKLNQNLMEKMAEMKKKSQGSEGSVDEMKQKMENSMRMANAYKREAEKSKEMTEGAKREVTGLKVELSNVQVEVKRLKALLGQRDVKANAAAAAAAAPAKASATGSGTKPPGTGTGGGTGGKAA